VRKGREKFRCDYFESLGTQRRSYTDVISNHKIQYTVFKGTAVSGSRKSKMAIAHQPPTLDGGLSEHPQLDHLILIHSPSTGNRRGTGREWLQVLAAERATLPFDPEIFSGVGVSRQKNNAPAFPPSTLKLNFFSSQLQAIGGQIVSVAVFHIPMSSTLLQSTFAQRGAQRAFVSFKTSSRPVRVASLRMSAQALSQDELKKQVCD
jgi:hypothetical protein